MAKFITNERVLKQIDVSCEAFSNHDTENNKLNLLEREISYAQNRIIELKLDLLRFEAFASQAHMMNDAVRENLQNLLEEYELELPKLLSRFKEVFSYVIALRTIKIKEENDLNRMKIEEGYFAR